MCAFGEVEQRSKEAKQSIVLVVPGGLVVDLCSGVYCRMIVFVCVGNVIVGWVSVVCKILECVFIFGCVPL